jgi:tetratricopeptide (TPR) repeat protein
MRRVIFICLLLVGITLEIYWPVSHLGFFSYDDPSYILNNQMVLGGLTPDSAWWAFTSYYIGNWHPVTWLSHMLDCQLLGLNPGAFHLENLAFHIANTLLLFIVLRKMTRSLWRSALVAALFAWHPAHIQSVAWITERKDVLSGFFMLLTLWTYAHYVEESKAQNPRAKFLLKSSLVLFALGLMSKPMLVTLPAILLLLDVWPLQRFSLSAFRFPLFRQLLLEKIPFFALSLLTVLTTFWSQNGADFIINTQKLPLLVRLANIPFFVVSYLAKLFWPVNLAVFYPYHFIPFWEQAVSFLLIALLTVIALRRMRSQPYVLVGWLWFLIMLLPVIGLVQVGGQSIADRYTYLPSIGIFVVVIWGLGEIVAISNRWLTIAGMALGATALMLGCLLDTRFQLKFWRDNITLFQRSVDVTQKDNATGYFGLADALWHDEGDLDTAVVNFKLALHCLQSKSDLMWTADAFGIRHNLGVVLLIQGRPAEAEIQFRTALPLNTNSDSAFTHKCLADALFDQGKTNEAEAEYDAAVQLMPGNGYLLNLVNSSKTLHNLLPTLKTAPTAENHVQAAEILCSQEKFPDAATHYLAALKNQPDAPELLNNLAWLLATCPNKKVRDGRQAVQYSLRACELTRSEQTIYVGTLAAAYAAAGNFDEAVVTARKACALAESHGETSLLINNQKLLNRFYLAHKPFIK